MEFVIKISQFLLSLSLLIVLHEFGHFLPARLFKTRVEKFYLFFDIKYSLFKKKIGETVYGIGWLPLGGYVKISGMIDESMDKEQMAEPPKPWEFRSKKAWQRLIIMLGGVIVNFIVALLIYIFGSFYYGDTVIPVDSLEDGFYISHPVLQEAGLQTGDKIIAIDGEQYDTYTRIRKGLINNGNVVTVSRNGVTQNIDLPKDFLGKLSTSDSRALLGPRFPFMVGSVPDTTLNAKAGLKEGDIITKINNQEVKFYDQFESHLLQYKNQTIATTVLRDDQELSIDLQVTEEGKLMIFPAENKRRFAELGYYDIVTKKYGFFESFGVGATKFIDEISGYGSQLKKIFTPSTGAYKGVGGFKAIFDIFPNTWSWESFWSITAFLSIMLGVLNLLPIPALDGGHVMFLLWEMITGRKPGDKFMEYAQVVGFFLLIALLLFANGNDIFKAITR
ncbi:MAG: RIP metalloprotease RseP [Bacteroidetes bacterium]|nr:RIP metalloprotease RseP [Bacteroidota bacterium]